MGALHRLPSWVGEEEGALHRLPSWAGEEEGLVEGFLEREREKVRCQQRQRRPAREAEKASVRGKEGQIEA